MKIIKFLTLLLCSIVYAQSGGSSSQDKFLPNITPPSTQANALGNYGNLPVGLFTGSANISVPLLEYKTSNINLPINLFYGSNGLKVDDISGSYGLGWNLNFGGVITRTVRDLADELQQGITIPESASGGYGNAVAATFFNLAGDVAADTEQDLYSFSYNGNSGKFVFDKNGKPVLSDQQKIKIEPLTAMQGFVITSTEGIKYYFTEIEQTIFRSMGVGHSVPEAYPTAWYLTKIAHPSGDEVYLTYENNNYYYTASQSQSLTFSYPFVQVSCANSIYTKQEISGILSHTMRIVGKKISKISSNKPVHGEIRFIYNSTTDLELSSGAYNKVVSISKFDENSIMIDQVNFNYLLTANNRTFLQSLTFKDPAKSYGFEYVTPNIFPARLSKSQDHWGYFNGQINTNIVPSNLSVNGYELNNLNYSGSNKEPQANYAKMGMLAKIIYPTKGYTEFDYEGNDYFGSTIIQPLLTQEFLFVSGGENQFGQSQDKIISNSVHQYIKVTGSASFNPSCPPHADAGKSKGFLTVTCLEDNTHVQLLTLSQYGYTAASTNQFLSNEISYYFNAEPNKTYKIKLATSFECTNTSISINYRKGNPQTVEMNLPTGGIRIKSTKDVNENSSLYKRYFYAKKNSLNKSSGDKGSIPVYYDIKTTRNNCNQGLCIYYDTTDMVVNSSSMLTLFDTGNSNCYYKDVTISEGGDNFENGGETKSFRINRDYLGNQVLGNIIYSSPLTNFGWDNGQELSLEIFDKNKQTIKQIVNEYKLEEAYNEEIKSYSVRKNFDLICANNTLHSCTQYEIQNYPANPCYGKTDGTQVYIPDVSNLDIMEYKLISYWHYLKSKKTTDYLNGLPVLFQKEYFYNNPSHFQLTNDKTTSPNGVINETTYQYAQDKGNQLMIDRNMVGIPLETTTTQTIGGTTKTLSKTETIYPTSLPNAQTGNLVLPTSVLSYDLQNPTSSTTEVTYDKYDSKGNIQQYTTKDGIPTAIIWGYNNTQPIAKIVGATYAQVSSLAATIISASDTDASAAPNNDETAFLTALDNFRKDSSMAGYQITTYTYDPLIGVRSITPPSGIREVYLYDTANRLKEIREQNQTGKLLKEFKYNYKN